MPPYAIARRPVITLTLKRDADGFLKGQKARITFPGNRLAAAHHYEPGRLSMQSPAQDSIRLISNMVAHDQLDL